LDWIFQRINGILFPGGGADLNGTILQLNAAYLYQKAITANNHSDYFVIEGHCMGFELEAIITTNNTNILVASDAENISLRLQIEGGSQKSKWFGETPDSVLSILSKQAVAMNNHVFCITPDVFNGNAALRSFYRILATSVDKKGKEFVANWESINFPIYGMQFHAEKPQFEWNVGEVINHSEDSISANSWFGRFFVNEARKSNHQFDNAQQESEYLIYNYSPIYSESIDSDFEQVYVW